MRIIMLTLATILSSVCFGQGKLSVDRSEIKIGDQITATISVDLSSNRELVNVDEIWPDTIDAIELVSGPIWNMENPQSSSAIWKVAFFDTGWIRIPPLLLVIKNGDHLDTIYTNDVPIKVLPVMPDSNGLEEIKGIYIQPFSAGYYKKYIPHALGVLLALVGLYFWLRQRKSKHVEAPPAPLPPQPEEWASIALTILAEKKLWQQGEVKEHYTELTGILREYLERRFGIHAMEQTSDEILIQLKKRSLSNELLADTEQLLSIADLIKFAKADPGMDIHTDTIKRVHSFVDETTPRHRQEDLDNDKITTDADME